MAVSREELARASTDEVLGGARVSESARGSYLQSNASSLAFAVKYVFWQQVAAFAADLLAADGIDPDLDVLAIGASGAAAFPRACAGDGGGSREEGTKRGSGGGWLCRRVLMTSNGVTVMTRWARLGQRRNHSRAAQTAPQPGKADGKLQMEAVQCSRQTTGIADVWGSI